jgi:hypothetical protein
MRTGSGIRVWLVLVLPVLLLGAACTPSGPMVWVESPSSIQVNNEVTVSVKAGDIGDLTALEIHLSFDPGILEVIRLDAGDFLAPDFVVQNTFDNTAGTIDYAAAQINRAPANGSGTLLEIVFRAKASGDSPLAFRVMQAAPAGVLLADSSGLAIEVALKDGNIKVK